MISNEAKSGITLVMRSLYGPIVSCKGTLTEQISMYVDCILQKNSLNTHLSQRYHIFSVNGITHLVTPECLLVTMGFNSLYAIILHTDGVEACRSFVTMNTTDQTSIKDIPAVVNFILKHDFFVLDNKLYLLINGTAMEKNGTKIRQYFYALC